MIEKKKYDYHVSTCSTATCWEGDVTKHEASSDLNILAFFVVFFGLFLRSFSLSQVATEISSDSDYNCVSSLRRK